MYKLLPRSKLVIEKGATGFYKETSIQHLFAYNVGAHDATIDLSKIALGDAPTELDSYKLSKVKYTYKDNKWDDGSSTGVETEVLADVNALKAETFKEE